MLKIRPNLQLVLNVQDKEYEKFMKSVTSGEHGFASTPDIISIEGDNLKPYFLEGQDLTNSAFIEEGYGYELSYVTSDEDSFWFVHSKPEKHLLIYKEVEEPESVEELQTQLKDWDAHSKMMFNRYLKEKIEQFTRESSHCDLSEYEEVILPTNGYLGFYIFHEGSASFFRYMPQFNQFTIEGESTLYSLETLSETNKNWPSSNFLNSDSWLLP